MSGENLGAGTPPQLVHQSASRKTAQVVVKDREFVDGLGIIGILQTLRIYLSLSELS